MKVIKFTGLVLLAATLSVRLMAQESKEQLVVPLSDPGKAYKLNVELTTGSIKVTGYDGKDVIIDATGDLSRRDRDRGEERNGMHRISGSGGMDIEAHEKNNTVTVGSNNPGKNITLTIKVPQGATSVKLGTVNGGVVSASDVSGDLEISNVNGGIKLTNVSGSVVANTVNGSVVVTLKAIDPKAAMAFTTLNGNVDVTFPASLKANVKLRSDRGDIYTDFDLAPNTSANPAKTTRTAKDGMFRVSIEDWVNGKINGGGPELLMKNMQGNIYIRKAK